MGLFNRLKWPENPEMPKVLGENADNADNRRDVMLRRYAIETIMYAVSLPYAVHSLEIRALGVYYGWFLSIVFLWGALSVAAAHFVTELKKVSASS